MLAKGEQFLIMVLLIEGAKIVIRDDIPHRVVCHAECFLSNYILHDAHIEVSLYSAKKSSDCAEIWYNIVSG